MNRTSLRWAAFVSALALVGVGIAACLRGGERDPAQGVEIIGTRGTQRGQFSRPRAVAITRSGSLYIIDRTGRMQVLELDTGKVTAQVQLPAHQNGTPTGISVDNVDDTVWVADTHYQRILHYSQDGTLLGQFGAHGTGPGEMIFPTDVGADPDGEHLWVTEFGVRNRLILFKRDGTFVREWGGPEYQESELMRPMSVEVDDRGRVYVVDAGHHRVNVYDRDGALLFRFGTPGTGPGELKYPYDLAFGPEDTLYVLEYGNDRVSRFRRDGTFLDSWGVPGDAPGALFSPWGVAVGPKGEVVIADTNNNRLQLLRHPEKNFRAPEPPRPQ